MDRLSFPTEFRSLKELKINIVVLFLICLTYFTISTLILSVNAILFSRILLVGTLAYELILFYLVFTYTKLFIKSKIHKGNTKTAITLLTYFVFGALLAFTAFTLIYTMSSVTPTLENKFISSLTALLLIVIPTFYWHELVTYFDKKYFKYLKFIMIAGLVMTLSTPVNALTLFDAGNQTETNQTSTDVWSILSGGLGFIQSVSNMYNSFQSTIQGWLNLDPWASQMIMIILILIAAFFLFKFLSFIIKWVIVGLIVWVVAQLFFI